MKLTKKPWKYNPTWFPNSWTSNLVFYLIDRVNYHQSIYDVDANL